MTTYKESKHLVLEQEGKEKLTVTDCKQYLDFIRTEQVNRYSILSNGINHYLVFSAYFMSKSLYGLVAVQLNSAYSLNLYDNRVLILDLNFLKENNLHNIGAATLNVMQTLDVYLMDIEEKKYRDKHRMDDFIRILTEVSNMQVGNLYAERGRYFLITSMNEDISEIEIMPIYRDFEGLPEKYSKLDYLNCVLQNVSEMILIPIKNMSFSSLEYWVQIDKITEIGETSIELFRTKLKLLQN